MLLRALKLPTFGRHAEDIAMKAEREGWTFGAVPSPPRDLEVEERRRRRIERYSERLESPGREDARHAEPQAPPAAGGEDAARRSAKAPSSNAETTSSSSASPVEARPTWSCAIGHELIRRGHRVLFTATFALVQRLLGAKRDLRLEKELAALDTFDAVILDDIGYVQQSRDEMEVLFTFLAERYERRSVIITSNLVFSEWDRIFKDPMTTAAAIDRLVHHAVILEMTGPSVRETEERRRREKRRSPRRCSHEHTARHVACYPEIHRYASQGKRRAGLTLSSEESPTDGEV